ncbi:hypothetical protein B0H14DRAFT_2582477 [Mycena olivaceomarginata]|nr:hypothetical protein B0H14DRAFT_2582477 [Mycena olivaceomarginata]
MLRWSANSCCARGVFSDMPGRWQGCAAVLNSFETLVSHVSKIHIQEEQIDTLRCRWEGCTAELSDQKRLVAHTQAHVLETIPCAYQDCNETFRKPRELVERNVRHKEQGTALKKSPRPTAPQQLLPLPELVQDIPAWATLAPTVRISRIPRETPEDSEYLGNSSIPTPIALSRC